jgi:glycosyltransferase involved in cell wall biosynthesis
MIKVLLIGSLPPPIGGVTIHIDRFFNLFKNNDKFELSVLDIKKKTLFLKDGHTKNIWEIFLYFLKTKIVHIHISNDYAKLFFAMISKLMFKKIIYTHHNSLVKNKFVFKLMYNICDKIILVNDKEINKTLIIDKKTEVIPAFLPPYKFKNLPEFLENDINSFDNIISTNCYYYSLINNKHVYGFDLIIDAFYKLSKNKKIKNTILILVDPSNTTSEFVSQLLKDKEFATNKVLHITQNIDFVSLVKKSNITIRATRTDGDSLSIRESLYFNIPIIASDVTVRPEGTIIFKNEDSNDLSNKVLEVLKSKTQLNYFHVNYGEKIIKVYEKVLNENFNKN